MALTSYDNTIRRKILPLRGFHTLCGNVCDNFSAQFYSREIIVDRGLIVCRYLLLFESSGKDRIHLLLLSVWIFTCVSARSVLVKRLSEQAGQEYFQTLHFIRWHLSHA